MGWRTDASPIACTPSGIPHNSNQLNIHLRPFRAQSLIDFPGFLMGVIGCIIGSMLRSDTLKITPEILGLIARIDEFKGAWRSLGTLAPDRLSALRRVASIESIGSSTRIEGSKLTDREVEKLLSNLAIQSLETRDEQEVAGYAELMDLVFSAWRDIPFNENHFKQLHQILLRHSEKDARHRGAYKTSSNSVAAFDENGVQIGIVFATASPFDTPRLVAELVAWVNEERVKAQLHPLLIIAIFVVVFLEIHPFQDGNGRLSRVLTTLLLIQAGYVYVPYSSLESVIEFNKEAYYLALRQTQGSIRTDAPNWQPWLVFFLRSLAEQVRRLEKKVERERIVLATLPELSLQIVEFAREHGRVTIGDAIKLTGASRNTLKQHFRNLVEHGHLNQHGSGRGVWYELK
ncbi:Fic family protein [Rhodoferax sp.]|uniref:Fic family protein n=1 Tax=Rhodoferax sp. TaxID=50421 RepID=UPI0025D9D6D9|nr:Fic family protein [Rhodoferax sp.]